MWIRRPSSGASPAAVRQPLQDGQHLATNLFRLATRRPNIRHGVVTPLDHPAVNIVVKCLVSERSSARKPGIAANLLAPFEELVCQRPPAGLAEANGVFRQPSVSHAGSTARVAAMSCWWAFSMAALSFWLSVLMAAKSA